MPVNLHKTRRWKKDVAESVDFYNRWFLSFAPQAYRDSRNGAIAEVQRAMELTENLRDITTGVLTNNPKLIQILRMATCPPIARDRLIGLAQVPLSLVDSMEKDGKLPLRSTDKDLQRNLDTISRVIRTLLDQDIFPWIQDKRVPSSEELYRGASIVADRLCGALTDPIIRNAQETRQLTAIKEWLDLRRYKQIKPIEVADWKQMSLGTYAFRLNICVRLSRSEKTTNIPVDVAIMPLKPKAYKLPILIEAKSAGDFTNTNKRRKEEAQKVTMLRQTFGKKVIYVLFLCGYFDSGYLGYEAAEGIDWFWEHRIDDLAGFGV